MDFNQVLAILQEKNEIEEANQFNISKKSLMNPAVTGVLDDRNKKIKNKQGVIQKDPKTGTPTGVIKVVNVNTADKNAMKTILNGLK